MRLERLRVDVDVVLDGARKGAELFERVVGVGGAEEGLDGEQDGADLERGGPFVCGHRSWVRGMDEREIDNDGTKGGCASGGERARACRVQEIGQTHTFEDV